MKKSLKTPLRYPGGKSRAVQKMAQFFPNLSDYAEYKEPFIGGGSVAIYISQMFPHLNVWVNDLYKPLVTFWVGLRDVYCNRSTTYKWFLIFCIVTKIRKELSHLLNSSTFSSWIS
jgi:site-specific DNA-adenine methylase